MVFIIKVEVNRMTRKDFAEKFLFVFANGIEERVKRKVGIGGKNRGYLWHLFNYKLVPCFEGDKARSEFDNVEKTESFEIQYDKGDIGDKETVMLSKEHLTAKKIDDSGFPEFYIIGKDFSWCYVVTHEFNLCGPYFCYAPKFK